ncbi:MAG: amidase [Actinobacteria bacterium]|nr:amidase [Actinomycetota bacterium]
MATFVVRMDGGGGGARLAVKDCIDVAGVPTTAGSRVVAAMAEAAPADAACLAGARAAGARIVGKANLHELCFGSTGVNPWFGTPRNPLDPALVPGGSSSGSAVAVATGEADVAFGTDTAGSVRNPAACCGVVGLKTTHGRVPLDGVWPLAPSLDTVGPLGRDVRAVELGMALLEPGFCAAAPAARLGRLRRPLLADAAVDVAVDAALAAAELDVVDVDLPGWALANEDAATILFAEALEVNRRLVDTHIDGLGDDLRARFRRAREIPPGRLAAARAGVVPWRDELRRAFERVELLVLPTMLGPPPRLDDPPAGPNRAAMAVNLAGVPALALPVPTAGPLPASLQLVGPAGSEERLVATAARIEAAVAAV